MRAKLPQEPLPHRTEEEILRKRDEMLDDLNQRLAQDGPTTWYYEEDGLEEDLPLFRVDDE